jgi:hypothetical protein
MDRFNLRTMGLVGLLLVLLPASMACGGKSSSHFAATSGPSSSSGGGIVLNLGDGSAEGGVQGIVEINPPTTTVTVVTGQPIPTVKLTASVHGTPVNPMWSVEQSMLGTIRSDGTFTPTGNVAGTCIVQARYDGYTGTASVIISLQVVQNGDPAWSAQPAAVGTGGYGGVGGDGPGGAASNTQITALKGTPAADATVSWIYPYNGTVWPQGLLAPLLQWQSGSHNFDSIYVDLKENAYEYKGTFAANATPFNNLPIPQAAWDSLSLSNAGEPIQASIVLGENGKAYGPYSETWIMAQAMLQGAIYYNSYGTSLVTNSGTDGLDYYGNQYGAATLVILPKATSPALVAGVSSINPTGDGTGCRVCHTVAGSGNRLVTQASNMSASDYSETVALDLANDTTGGAGTPLQTANLTFPALSRDGNLLLSGSGGMRNSDSETRLYSLPAGAPVPGVTGLPSGLQAALPAFSPDTQHASFNFWGGSWNGINADQISLAVIDFDGTSSFSNPRVLYTPPMGSSGPESVTFSSFLPTGTGVVFEVELSNPSGAWAYTWEQNTGELWWADIASGQAHRLDRLDGYDASGNIYLPDNTSGMATHTAAQDVTLNYEPTVGPIAAGGYAWAVFTSRRMYGNVAQIAPWTSDPRLYPWRDQITDKKLWVAAIDLNAAPGTDPSHPAFYLPAQEIHAGNSRAFWAFQSCLADGLECTEGTECCGGYCRGGDAGGMTCTSTPQTCSASYEKCTTSSDCCGAAAGTTCVNQVCTPPAPPQ